MNLVGFTAHPYQNYPELPLPKDGVLKKNAILFCYSIKWGRKIYFSLKMGRSYLNGRRKKGIYRATYTYCLNIFIGVPPPGLIRYTLVDEEF